MTTQTCTWQASPAIKIFRRDTLTERWSNHGGGLFSANVTFLPNPASSNLAATKPTGEALAFPAGVKMCDSYFLLSATPSKLSPHPCGPWFLSRQTLVCFQTVTIIRLLNSDKLKLRFISQVNYSPRWKYNKIESKSAFHLASGPSVSDGNQHMEGKLPEF